MTTPPEPTAPSEATDGPAAVGRLASISLDCPDPSMLAAFYSDLLGLRRVFATDDDSIVALSDGTVALTMMRVQDHVPPTWPGPGQGQQMHLDVSVNHLIRLLPPRLPLALNSRATSRPPTSGAC